MPTKPVVPTAVEHYLGIGKQASKGTGVVPSHFLAYLEPVEARPGKNIREVREGGGGAYIQRGLTDLYVPAWGGAVAARPDIAAALFAYFLGTAGVPTGTDPYTHTLTPAQTVTKWISAERNIDDEIMERFVDGFIIEMVLDIRKRDSGPEAILEVKGSSLGLEVQAAATSDAYETDLPFLRSQATWKLDGAAITNIESARVTMRWIFDEARSTDGLIRADTAKIQFETDLEVVTLYNTAADAVAYLETMYPSGSDDGSGTVPAETVWQKSATDSFDVNFDNGEATVDNRQFGLNIAKVEWTDAVITEPNPEATEAARLTRTGRLIKAASPLTVTVINSIATDYLA